MVNIDTEDTGIPIMGNIGFKTSPIKKNSNEKKDDRNSSTKMAVNGPDHDCSEVPDANFSMKIMPSNFQRQQFVNDEDNLEAYEYDEALETSANFAGLVNNK